MLRRCLTVVLPIVTSGVLCWVAHGQDQEPATLPADAIRTYRAAVTWLEAWETPRDWELPDGITGAWVGIRLSGRLIGEGQDMRSALETAPSADALTRAMRQAMVAAEDTMAAGGADPAERIDRRLALRAAPTTLELQLAHRPARVRALDFDRLARQFRPGMDGIIVRVGGKVTAIFPGQMLAHGQTPDLALFALYTRSGLNEIEFNNGLLDGRVRVWRFEVQHLTQPMRGAEPSFMMRGTRLVDASLLTGVELRRFAQQMFAHLRGRQFPGSEQPLGIMGTYRVTADRYEPPVAPPHEQALAAYAMLRFARMAGLRAEVAESARRAARRVLDDLAELDAVIEIDPAASVGSAAMTLIALGELGDSPLSGRLSEMSTRCRATLDDAFDPLRGFDDEVSYSEQAVCAFALGTEEAADHVWQSTPAVLHPSLMPWLGWAEQRLAGDGPLRSAAGLMAFRSQVWSTQVAARRGGRTPPDLAGGLAFRGRRPPDWNSARPLAFIASMLRDQRITTDDQILSEVYQLTQGLRFLRQLSIREADRYWLRNPDRALGGLRSALWTSRMPVSATAMGLIAVVEAVESLNEVSNRLPPER